jgi:hypothetical protein
MFRLKQLFESSCEDNQQYELLLMVEMDQILLKAIKPGISASASMISFLPNSANEMSLTLYFKLKSICDDVVVFDIFVILWCKITSTYLIKSCHRARN